VNPSNLEQRAQLLELEAALQRQTLRASIDAVRDAKAVTLGLAGAAIVSRAVGISRFGWIGYALLAAKLLLGRRRHGRANRGGRATAPAPRGRAPSSP
jgi:transketolase C-terminal domain/subunit